MMRYAGEDLPRASRIAVVANDALGNFVVVTPLLQMLRERFAPAELDYVGGTRLLELAERSPLVDRTITLFGSVPRAFVRSLPDAYHLVINVEKHPWAKCAAAILAGETGYVCGPSLDVEGRSDLPFPGDLQGDLWRDKEWIAEDIRERYPFLHSGFIGEIFCRLAYLEGPVPGYQLPSQPPAGPVPDVLISTAASLPEKLWPVSRWAGLVRSLRSEGLRVGLLGARPDEQRKYWRGGDVESEVVAAGASDLRGRLSLPEVVGAIGGARAVVTIDNGIAHLACATETPTVGLYRHGIHRLWAPPAANLTVLEPGVGRQVADIPPEVPVEAVGQVLERGSTRTFET